MIKHTNKQKTQKKKPKTPTHSIEGTPDSFGNANATRDQIGWVSQLAFRRDIRRLVMTRNTGTVGYVGLKRGTPGAERNSGWYVWCVCGVCMSTSGHCLLMYILFVIHTHTHTHIYIYEHM